MKALLTTVLGAAILTAVTVAALYVMTYPNEAWEAVVWLFEWALIALTGVAALFACYYTGRQALQILNLD